MMDVFVEQPRLYWIYSIFKGTQQLGQSVFKHIFFSYFGQPTGVHILKSVILTAILRLNGVHLFVLVLPTKYPTSQIAKILNRPGVAGAVLQTAPSLID